MKNNTNKLVSVIVPIYNAGEYLEECLNAITSQTYQCLEIILVNDGSTDNSAGICRTFMKKDSRVIYVPQKNGGVSSARNKGLDTHTGEFCVFIDADDVVSSDYVMHLLRVLEDNRADLITIPALPFMGASSEALSSATESDSIKILSSTDALLAMYYGVLDGGENGMQLFRSSLLKKDKIRYNSSMKIGEDFDFLSRLVLSAELVIADPSHIYFYRTNPNSAMNRNINLNHFQAIDNVTQSAREVLGGYFARSGELRNAMNVRKFSDAVYYGSRAYSTRREFKAEYDKCLVYIDKYKFEVFMNSQAKITTRTKALIAMIIGSRALTFIFKGVVK